MHSTREKCRERRREQNRLAQRRFRERHNAPKKTLVFHPSTFECQNSPLRSASASPEYLSFNLFPQLGSAGSSSEATLFACMSAANREFTQHDFTSDPIFSAPLMHPIKGAGTEAVSMQPFTQIDPSLSSEDFQGGIGELCAQDQSWLSPLHMAAIRGYDKIVELLVQHISAYNEDYSDGRTPLIRAVMEGSTELVEVLLQHSARVDDVDLQGRSSLHWAVANQQPAILRLLLEHCHGLKATVNAYDNQSQTPLHLAIAIGFEEGVRILLHYGADVYMKARNITDGESNQFAIST